MSETHIDSDTLARRLDRTKRHIELTLGLPLRSLSDKDFEKQLETQILYKMLYNMPWLFEVAEHEFNPEKAELILAREAINIKLKG